MHTRRDFLKLSALFTATAAMPLLQACGKRTAMQKPLQNKPKKS